MWNDAPPLSGLRFGMQVDRIANRLYVADGSDRVMALAVTPPGLGANNTGATVDVISFIGPVKDNNPYTGGFPSFFSGNIDVLALSPDRRWLLGAGTSDGVVAKWATPADGGTGAMLVRYVVPPAPVGLTFTSSGRHVVMLMASGDLYVYGFDTETGGLNTGGFPTSWEREISVGDSGGRIISIGDVDNNGFEDYAVIKPSTAGHAYTQVLTDVAIVLSDADGPLRLTTEGLVTCRGVTDIAAADFDDDSNVDLVISCWSEGVEGFEFAAHEVYLRKGRGDGTFQQGANFVN